MPYEPYDLPQLPRPECPYEVAYADRGNIVKCKPCNQPTLAHGWCTEHAFVQEILELAWKANYGECIVASLPVGKHGHMEACYTIGTGRSSWERYAVRADKKHTATLKRRLMEAIAHIRYSRSEKQEAV